MDTPMIHTEIDSQGVAHICLDRPAQRNAFNPEMIEQIIDALARFEDEPCVRALALSARGEHFCAGADIGWMRRAATFTKAQNLADARRLAHLMSQLDRFSKPTIAQVQGSVFGGAIGLIACCDMVVASCDTRFCLSEVKLGLIPAVISPYLARVVGMRALRRYALSAEVIDTPAALQLGLVHHIEALPSTTAHQWLVKV
ncbi:MAG: enoyl-CoA hydratase-related protein, partial [Pseudomonadales bacterium]